MGKECCLNVLPNDIKILLSQIKSEVDELVKTTDAKLLAHDEKIAELCLYLKTNLDNTLRAMVDSMKLSGELDEIITDVIVNEMDELRFRVVHPEDFGVFCDDIYDDREGIQKAIKFASKKGLTIDLGNKTYYIKSKCNNYVFDGVENCKIMGFATIKISDVIGNYEGVFNITGDNVELRDFTIDENTSFNPIDSKTGSKDNRRCGIYAWNDTPVKNIVIDNIKIKDSIGVWQITIDGENVQIKNCQIDYAKTGTPTYDRTSIYMNGFNFLCSDNILNGSDIARTGIETHGNHIKVLNNHIKNYNSCIYITNEWSRIDETLIDDIVVKGNHCSTRRGLGIWLTNKNISVDSITIDGNFIDVLNDEDVLYLYSLVGGGIDCKTITITNNTLKNDSENKEHALIKFYNTQNDRLSSVVIKNLIVDGNLLDGYCKYGVVLETQANNNLVIENTKFINNIFNIGHLYGNQLVRITDTQFNFKNVLFKNNEVKVGGADSTITLFNFNIFERTNNLDSVKAIDNIFNIGRGYVLCNTNAKYCFRLIGVLDINLQHNYNQSFIHSGHLKDYEGQEIFIKDNLLTKIFRASSPLSGSENNYFRKGDVIFNTNPVIGEPIGWMCISNPNNFRPMSDLQSNS